jgi:signal transduction histidine kinase
LPPLRHRASELPAIITTVAHQLSRDLNLLPAAFTPRAIHRLSNYLWFGNLAELETVLTRSLTLAPHRPLDTPDLLFGYGPLVRTAATSSPTTAEPLPPPTDTKAVDLVINELAHEFKNPMVTIKTISQHLDRLLADEEGRHHVAQITGEAVDRMDRALENLLQFTRFGNPAPTNVSLNALLAPCLSELASLLTERHVVLNYQPAEPIQVHVDAEQIAYAAENLLRSVVRDLPEGETLSIRAAPSPATLSIEFSNQHQGVAARLTQFLDGADELGDPALPLGLLFARTLIQRNGGGFGLKINQGQAVITVRLPGQQEIAIADGKTTNPHC